MQTRPKTNTNGETVVLPSPRRGNLLTLLKNDRDMMMAEKLFSKHAMTTLITWPRTTSLLAVNRQVKRNAPLLALAAVLVVVVVRMDRDAFRREIGQKIEDEVRLHQAKRGQLVVQVFSQEEEGNARYCDNSSVITSSRMDSRLLWADKLKQEGEANHINNCSKFKVSYMIPRCRLPVALASYPGSGNTWVRYLIEAATGIFTGSRYKDLELQMYGFWGEIREWSDGTTLVQKTHDATMSLIQEEFGGRGILLVRNPYAAILSQHNYLFAGHHGVAPAKNYDRKDWVQFVTIQTSKWLEMVVNWATLSSPQNVLVIHYENLREELLPEMRKILTFLSLPIDESRLRCLSLHTEGFFRRKHSHVEEKVPLDEASRREMDDIIDGVNSLLTKNGYEALPLDKYDFFRKSDEQILAAIREKNSRNADSTFQNPAAPRINKGHGTKMVLQQYFKWLDGDEKALKTDDHKEDMKTALMRQLFKAFRENSEAKTVTGLSEKAEGILTKAVELWPIIQKPFQKDPIETAIEDEGFRGKTLADLKPRLQPRNLP